MDYTFGKYLTSSTTRAVGTIIATLLLIAITVVGGTITSVYTSGIMSNAQISGHPEIEFIEIIGYDTRDACTIIDFSGYETSCGTAGFQDPDSFLRYDERIAVYLVNHSVKKVLLSEVRFGGDVYNVTSSSTLTTWNDFIDFVPGQYAISDSGTFVFVPNNQEIQPGQTVTLILDLESDFKTGRTAQMRIETANNAVIVNDITIGEHVFLR